MKMTNQLRKEAADIISKIFKNSTGQLFLGAFVGYAAGHTTLILGKPIAFGTGVGVIAYQIANYNGLLKDDIIKTTSNKTKNLQNQYSQKIPSVLNNIKQFSRMNRPLTLGFIGGMLIGIST